jgi:polar amino acid transport system substrate-binding protein
MRANRKRFLSLAKSLLPGALLVALAIAAEATAGDIEAAKRELAPTGKLRVGLVSAPKANVFFVTADASGTPRGVTADLGNRLAGTLGVPSDFVVAHNSGEVTAALEQGLVDVAFLPIDDERRKRVDFGPAYVQFESTCLVLGTSDFKTVSDLDRADVRVGGEANTTTMRAVASVLKAASIVPITSVGEAMAMLRGGQIDAFALGRDSLVPYQQEIPGSRILEGHFHVTGIAIAVAKNRAAALAYAHVFIEEAKASGLIRRTFDDAGMQAVAVAPPE